MVESSSDNSEETVGDGDDAPETSSEEGLSPEKLGEAFAGMLSPDNDSDAATVDEARGSAESEESAGRDADSPIEAEEAGDVSPRGILEAMLFVGNSTNEPLTADQASGLMRGVTPVEIDELVRELNASYASRGCPYCIVSADAGYRMILRDEFAGLRDKFYGRLRQARLTPAAIEVLATVAYKQPLTKDQINHFRKTSSSSILAQLVRRQLLRLERPTEKPRTPFYSTTERFLRLFDLESLDDLPRRQEMDKR